jgi:phage baseplate assembly protein gpV
MADNIIKTKGQASGYKFDRGGMPAEFGPYIGVVKNNVDPTRAGRLQVYIEQFGGDRPDDVSLWRTVSYIPPFYGATPHQGTTTGVGTYKGNQQSYGMWFTPPDLGTQVICFFVAGDPNQGYYLGCVPEAGINHMIPAIGATARYQVDSEKQEPYLTDATQVPVTEINNENPGIIESPRFWDQIKPVHSWITGVMIQQGVIRDPQRGPITSSSQRESPSSTFGISTPGRPIYQSGLTEKDIQQKLDAGTLTPTDIQVTGRRGGHSLVMDDGDLRGYDNLIRLRTSKGHQITMSDDGDFFYILHANGQTWIELGSEGTVDVFATNSVNVRTRGEINLHADKTINMYAGEAINIKSDKIKVEAVDLMELISANKMNQYATNAISVLSDGTLALKNATAGGWNGGDTLAFKAGKIDLNGPAPPTADKAVKLEDKELPDTTFTPNQGWGESPTKIKTIVSRAPTHEPYPYHNRGVDVQVELTEGGDVKDSDDVPAETTIVRTA